jgi:putative DNA primase/helicase
MKAETIARALRGRRAGGTWMARCPAHEDRTPSLAITDAIDGGVLVRCHAGCDQRDIIAALRARGLWEPARRHNSRLRLKFNRRVSPSAAELDAMQRTQAVLAIWQASQPPEGSPVETYLRSRGLTIPVPTSIRFQAGLKHRSGGVWPAMVALVTHGVDGKPIGIHRTFLARDGKGKAPVDPAKMMLGPCRGGAVRLGPDGDVLMQSLAGGEVAEAIVLANNATETVWFQTLASAASAFCFPRGRIKFWHPGKGLATPLQGQTIIYSGNRVAEFRNKFSKFGVVSHL